MKKDDGQNEYEKNPVAYWKQRFQDVCEINDFSA